VWLRWWDGVFVLLWLRQDKIVRRLNGRPILELAFLCSSPSLSHKPSCARKCHNARKITVYLVDSHGVCFSLTQGPGAQAHPAFPLPCWSFPASPHQLPPQTPWDLHGQFVDSMVHLFTFDLFFSLHELVRKLLKPREEICSSCAASPSTMACFLPRALGFPEKEAKAMRKEHDDAAVVK